MKHGQVWPAKPVEADVDDVLVPAVLEALGCGAEPVVREPKPARADRSQWIPHSASSAERATTGSYVVATARCRIEVERVESFFPGDVNEPPREWHSVKLACTRSEPPASVQVVAFVGERDLRVSVEAASEAEAERIYAAITAAVPEA